ncbi:MAG: divergent polysaccharide deacetylase family protein, partial [Methylovirgula sp.]
MTGDDLNTPLGRNRVPRRPVPYRVICLASAGLLVLGGIIYLSFRGDPFGGEPHAVATITQVAPAPAAPPPAAQAAPVDTQPTGTIVPASDANSAAAIERRSGVKIVRNGNAAPPGAEIIDVPQVLADRLAPAPDPRLVEHGRYGLLPRIGKNGARAADVYARPYAKSAKPNAPKIALVVGGVGLNDAATAQAIESLPGPVTLAFAPYGNDLKGKVAQAREAGHEVILQ